MSARHLLSMYGRGGWVVIAQGALDFVGTAPLEVVGGVLACGISVGVQAAHGRLRCLGTQVPGSRGDESSSVGLPCCAELRWEVDSIL